MFAPKEYRNVPYLNNSSKHLTGKTFEGTKWKFVDNSTQSIAAVIVPPIVAKDSATTVFVSKYGVLSSQKSIVFCCSWFWLFTQQGFFSKMFLKSLQEDYKLLLEE